MRTPRWFFLVLATLAAPSAARAQEDAARLIAQARDQIDALTWDSAFTLLQGALRRAPTLPERVRAYTLLAITQISRDDRVAARGAFEQALRLDGGLRVDSLADLHTEVRVVFQEARTSLGIADAGRGAAGPRLGVTIDVPADTTVPVTAGLLRIEVRPTYGARVMLSAGPADAPGLVLWADTAMVGGIATRTWNLRGRDGQLVAPGRYTLRAFATDSASQSSPIVDRTVTISRVAVDTIASPPPLIAFEPETLYLRRGSPAGLAAGLLVAASAVVLPSVLGNPDLQTGATYSTSYAVAGVVSLASVVGFLRGNRVRPMPGNAVLNAQARARDAEERQRIDQENARRREAAPIRVRLEGPGQ